MDPGASGALCRSDPTCPEHSLGQGAGGGKGGGCRAGSAANRASRASPWFRLTPPLGGPCRAEDSGPCLWGQTVTAVGGEVGTSPRDNPTRGARGAHASEDQAQLPDRCPLTPFTHRRRGLGSGKHSREGDQNVDQLKLNDRRSAARTMGLAGFSPTNIVGIRDQICIT